MASTFSILKAGSTAELTQHLDEVLGGDDGSLESLTRDYLRAVLGLTEVPMLVKVSTRLRDGAVELNMSLRPVR
jgi:hypothetical protein